MVYFLRINEGNGGTQYIDEVLGTDSSAEKRVPRRVDVQRTLFDPSMR